MLLAWFKLFQWTFIAITLGRVFDKVPVFRWRCNLRSGRWRTDWSKTLQKRFSKLKDNLLLLCYDHMLLVIRQELFVLRRCVTATAAEADTFFTQSWWSFKMFTMGRCCCCSVNNLCRSMQLKATICWNVPTSQELLMTKLYVPGDHPWGGDRGAEKKVWGLKRFKKFKEFKKRQLWAPRRGQG